MNPGHDDAKEDRFSRVCSQISKDSPKASWAMDTHPVRLILAIKHGDHVLHTFKYDFPTPLVDPREARITSERHVRFTTWYKSIISMTTEIFILVTTLYSRRHQADEDNTLSRYNCCILLLSRNRDRIHELNLDFDTSKNITSKRGRSSPSHCANRGLVCHVPYVGRYNLVSPQKVLTAQQSSDKYL